MAIFIITFLLVYGSIHCYMFMKLTHALSPGPALRIITALFMGCMVFFPFLERMLSRLGYEPPACIVALIGYCWMGFVFFFFFSAILFDVYHLFIRVCGLLSRQDVSHLRASARIAFLVPLVLSLAVSAYGYMEAKSIRTEHLTIKSSKIPPHAGRIRIVQISDVHIGVIIGESRLKEMLRGVISADPDILVSTGDLVDGQLDGLGSTKDLFRKIQPRLGKFTITGNHEFYAGLDQFMDFAKQTGFRVLRAEAVTVGGIINIAGVDDPAGMSAGLYRHIPEKELLSTVAPEKFTLLLKHKPLIDKESLGMFDLQLSGHTHKGQLFPFSIFTRLAFRYHTGYFDLDGGSRLYVSRGAGTWGPPMRVLATPEITVIDIMHGDK